MSNTPWMNDFLRRTRQEIEDLQALVNLLDPPKPKRRRRRQPQSAVGRELQAALRTSTVAPRSAEAAQITGGEREVSYVTRGGERDG